LSEAMRQLTRRGVAESSCLGKTAFASAQVCLSTRHPVASGISHSSVWGRPSPMCLFRFARACVA